MKKLFLLFFIVIGFFVLSSYTNASTVVYTQGLESVSASATCLTGSTSTACWTKNFSVTGSQALSKAYVIAYGNSDYWLYMSLYQCPLVNVDTYNRSGCTEISKKASVTKQQYSAQLEIFDFTGVTVSNLYSYSLTTSADTSNPDSYNHYLYGNSSLTPFFLLTSDMTVDYFSPYNNMIASTGLIRFYGIAYSADQVKITYGATASTSDDNLISGFSPLTDPNNFDFQVPMPAGVWVIHTVAVNFEDQVFSSYMTITVPAYSFQSSDFFNYSTSTATSSFSNYDVSQLASFCDTQFPYDNSSIISATITFLPNGLCKIISYMIVPSSGVFESYSNLSQILSTKVPFSFFYDITNSIDDLSVDSATSSVPTLIFSVATTTSPFHITNYNIMGDLNHFISSSSISVFRDWISYALWIGFAFMVFNRVKNII